MVEIKRSSEDLSKVEVYLMTLDNDIISCKDLEDGAEIEVEKWLEYTDTKDNGKSDDVFAIMASDGKVYACTSATFKRNVLEIADIMEGDSFTIVKRSGVSKAGKEFIYASLKH